MIFMVLVVTKPDQFRSLPLCLPLSFPPSFYIQVDAGHAIKSLKMSDESREAYLVNLRCELRRITNKEEKNVSQLVSPLSPQMLKQFDFDSTTTAKFQKWIPREISCRPHLFSKIFDGFFENLDF